MRDGDFAQWTEKAKAFQKKSKLKVTGKLGVIVKTCGSACHATFCWRPISRPFDELAALLKVAPARTRATSCGALTARQRRCADSMSLNAIAMPAAREPGPW